MPFVPPVKFTGTLQPGASLPLRGAGVFARVLAATGALNIGFDLGAMQPTSVGLGYQCLPGEQFSQVVIENPGATAVNYTVVTGRIRIDDNRLNIITGSDYLPVTEPVTKLVGQGIIALAGGANKILTGAPGAGQFRRAGVTIDNLDAALALTIYDDAAGVAGFVLPGSSRYLPLSGYVKISNDNGGAVACAIAEIWQLTP